jgi:hypothetical protein
MVADALASCCAIPRSIIAAIAVQIVCNSAQFRFPPPLSRLCGHDFMLVFRRQGYVTLNMAS